MIPWNQTSWNYFLPRNQNSANIQNLKVVTVILKSRLLTISVYKRDSNYFTYVKFATRWFNLTIFSCHHCSLVRLLGHRWCFFPWSHLTRDENNKNIKGTKICLPAQWKKNEHKIMTICHNASCTILWVGDTIVSYQQYCLYAWWYCLMQRCICDGRCTAVA